MAKAAPRVNANSEERALAAKQAREKYLAQVAANCHDEVQRAKKVAEDAREKKAAEHLRLKGVMEDRLAEAEKRRILYQQNARRSKNTLQSGDEKRLPISAWKPRNEVEAARFLQRAWKNRERRKLHTEMVQLGLSVEAIRAANFEDVGMSLNQPSILACASKILIFYGVHEGDANAQLDKGAVRTFLSAYLIFGHARQVLSKDGVQEQDLIAKATLMLEAFDQLIVTPLPHPSLSSNYPQLAAFLEAHSAFHSAFSAWKDNDSSILVSTMVAQFVGLDAIWQSVKEDTAGGVANDYKAAIQQNQTLILVGLKRLLGSEAAMAFVKTAIRESRGAKARTKRIKPSKQAQPRGDSDMTETGPQHAPPALKSPEDLLDRGSRVQKTALTTSLAALPDNRSIVHELAIDSEYRLESNSREDLNERCAEIVSQGRRDAVANSMEDLFVVEMLQIIRDKLLTLVSTGKSFHGLITETLDLSVIAKQVKMGAFSYQQFFAFVNTLLPQLCAPVRDTEVKALVNDPSQDPSERFAKTNTVLNVLLLDHANFSLQMNKPMLLAQAADYEKRCFKERFGDSPPIKTRIWWRSALAQCRADTFRRNGETSQTLSTKITPEKIYMQGLVGLAVAVELLPQADPELPETLELDRNRITDIRSTVLRITVISTILLTAKKLLKRDVRSEWKTEAQRMWQLPYDDPQAFIAAISQTLPPNTKTILAGTTESILTNARANTVHPVAKVLLQRIKSHILSRLTAASAEERIHAMTLGNEKLASCGLAEYVTTIGALSDGLKRIADVDRAAHGEWYDRIIDEA